MVEPPPGSEQIKALIRDIDKPREDIAKLCGVGIEALKKWIANGRIPKQKYVHLVELRKYVLFTKISQLSSSKPVFIIDSLCDNEFSMWK